MTARSQTKPFGLHLLEDVPRVPPAAQEATHVARMVLEQMQERVMLSAAPTTAWMGALPGSIPLTDISIPGTVNSASGPSLQDALMGSGAENMVTHRTRRVTG